MWRFTVPTVSTVIDRMSIMALSYGRSKRIRLCLIWFFFFQAEDGIRDLVRSRGLGDVYKRQVLSRLAVTGPGNCAYRALSRTAAGPVSEAQLRQSAFHVARGFQSLFNQGEAAAAVQLGNPGTKRVHWGQGLDYCLF